MVQILRRKKAAKCSAISSCRPRAIFSLTLAIAGLTFVALQQTNSFTRYGLLSEGMGVVFDQSFTMDCSISHVHKLFQETSFQSTWKEIDEFIASSDEHNSQERSGGIFLYPRQSHLLQHFLHALSNSKKKQTAQATKKEESLQICETGFAAGHSSALFLSTIPDAQIVSFDKFDRSYQIPVAQQLQAKFGQRLTYVKGDSCKTVPKYMEREDFKGCDILHGSSLCRSDNIDLVRYAPCGTILTSTAMPDIRDRAVYFGKKAQWRKLREDGCIDSIKCFREEPYILDGANYVFNTKKKSQMKMRHKFCVAVVTGKCYDKSGDDKGGNVGCDLTEKVSMFQDICPSWTIKIPE